MKYKIVSGNLKKVEAEVNELLEGKWEPLGAISICMTSVDDESSTKEELYFAQTMIFKS